MTDDELRDLEDPETWNLKKAQVHPSVKGARAVVSVAFPRPAFEQVSKAAEIVGMRLSEFIREAALEKASHHVEGVTLASASGSLTGAVIFNGRIATGQFSITRVPGSPQVQNGSSSVQEPSRVFVFDRNEPATV